MKHKKHIQRARKWMRLHVILTAIVFGVYFLAAFLYSPNFFLADIRNKLYAVADTTMTVTATVLGAPVKPIVNTTALCSVINGTLSSTIDWTDDTNSYTYDILRNGSTLVTGLTHSVYKDLNVAVGKSYKYSVIARGPMDPGSATSDTVPVTMPLQCAVPPPSTIIQVTTIGAKSLLDQSGKIQTVDKRPVFSGTTVIPYAIIDIIVHSQAVVVLRAVANANGYWSVEIPVDLSVEDHTMYITATDPDDGSQTATYDISFGVIQDNSYSESNNESAKYKKETASAEVITPAVPVIQDNSDSESSDESAKHKKETASAEVITPAVSVTRLPTGAPLDERGSVIEKTNLSIPMDFSLHINNADTPLFQGGVVESEVVMTRIDPEYVFTPAMLHYGVTDEKNVEVVSFDKAIDHLEGDQKIIENISLPQNLAQGIYTVQSTLRLGKFIIVRSARVSVAELPLFDLGGGFVITYPQFVRNIGWVAFALAFLLLWWLLLWIREYWLYTHATYLITEKNLSSKSLISKRKEVSS